MNSKKNKFFKKISIILTLILLVVLFFHVKEESSLDLGNCLIYQRTTFYRIITISEKNELKKLKEIFFKYKITCDKTIYLGYRIYSPYNREFDHYSSSRIKLLQTIYLIDKSSKISFERKKEYIEMLLTPLNIDNHLYESNLIKIRKLYFDDKI